MRLIARLLLAATVVLAGACDSRDSPDPFNSAARGKVVDAIEAANYCEKVSECVVVHSSCFLSNIVNVKEKQRIEKMTSKFSGCAFEASESRDLSRLYCVKGKCVAAKRGDPPGLYSEPK
jgi:hypothetical protein